MQTVKNKKEFYKSLGLVMAFVGMQFNTAIRNVFPKINIIVPIMVLSVILLVDLNGITKLKTNLKVFVLFMFQGILMFLCVLSSSGTTQLFTFHIYILALILALWSNQDYLDFSYFGRMLFYVSGFISIVILYQATKGFTQLIFAFDGTGKLWLEQGGDPITMSRALQINIIAVLFLDQKTNREKFVATIFIIADVIGLLSFNNRSTIVCSLFVTLLWLVNYYYKKITLKKIFVPIIMLFIIGIAFTYIPYFQNKIIFIYESIINGIGTLFGWQNIEIDPSAQTRNKILTDILNTYFNGNVIKNFVMGMGYNYKYVDRPILQIFFDLGIPLAVLSCCYLVFIPVKVILKEIKYKYNFNSAWVFVVYISIQSIADQFLTGLPYYYFFWTPTIFFLFSEYQNKQNFKSLSERIFRDKLSAGDNSESNL